MPYVFSSNVVFCGVSTLCPPEGSAKAKFEVYIQMAWGSIKSQLKRMWENTGTSKYWGRMCVLNYYSIKNILTTQKLIYVVLVGELRWH